MARLGFVALACLATLPLGCPSKLDPRAARIDAGAAPARITYDAAAPVDASVQDAGIDAAVPLPEPLDPSSMPPGPAVDGDFTHRIRHLLDAIATNDPALCHDVQLPRKAYAEDYATRDLVKTWDKGLDAAFKKQLARLHKRAKHVELAFVSVEVPKPMEATYPRERDGWRTPVWRAEHARLHVRPVNQAPGDAKDTTIDLASLVYWRGAWYVERL